MNKISYSQAGETIYFSGYVAKDVKRGDIVLRPIIPNSIADRIINWVMPGNFEHAMVYLGNGQLINIYPDANGFLHREDVFDNLSYYPAYLDDPSLIVFARISDSNKVVEAALAWLELNFDRLNVSKQKWLCSSLAVEAYVQAGVPRSSFKKACNSRNPLSWLAVALVDSGYEIARMSTRMVRFEKCVD